MKREQKITVVLIAAALIAAFAVGCGGDSSSSADSASNASETEASAEFVKPNQENTTAEFGQEADAAEREAASSVLEESMKARAEGDWATQCSTLTARAVKRIEGEAVAGGGAGCAKNLEAQAQPLAQTKVIRANTMTGPIDALRVQGSKGYALYHGTKEMDYAMPMRKEEGVWKVDAIIMEILP